MNANKQRVDKRTRSTENMVFEYNNKSDHESEHSISRTEAIRFCHFGCILQKTLIFNILVLNHQAASKIFKVNMYAFTFWWLFAVLVPSHSVNYPFPFPDGASPCDSATPPPILSSHDHIVFNGQNRTTTRAALD